MRNFSRNVSALRSLIAIAVLTLSFIGASAKSSKVVFNPKVDVSGSKEGTKNASITKDGITLMVSEGSFGKGTYYALYSSQKLSVKSERGTITRVDLACTLKGDSGPNQLKADGYWWLGGTEGRWQGKASSVTFDVRALVYLKKIEVTIDEDGQESKIVPGYKFEKSALLTNNPIVETSENKLNGVPDGLKIEYGVDNPDLAGIDINTGKVTFKKTGEVTVTASSEETYKYYEYSASYKLKYIEKDNTSGEGEIKNVMIWSDDFSDVVFPDNVYTLMMDPNDGFPRYNAYYYSVVVPGYTDVYIQRNGTSAGGKANEMYIRGGVGCKLRVVIPDLKGACGDLILKFLSNGEFKKENSDYIISTPTEGAVIKSVVSKTFGSKNNKYSTQCIVSVPENTQSLELVFSPLKSGENASLDNFVLTAENFSINVKTDEGYSTFYSEDAFIMPDGLEGTTVGFDESSGKLVFNYEYTAGNIVPAGTPLLLHSKTGKGSFIFNYTNSNTVGDNLENCLHGSAVDEEAKDVFNTADVLNYYILTYNDNNAKTGLGFYWNSENGGPNFINKAGKAFLAIPKRQSGSRGFSFAPDTVNGVVEVPLWGGNASTLPIYTIDGSRVMAEDATELPAGIYIVRGKKIVVK